MIVGVGIDVVPVERFAAALERTDGLGARLFTAAERVTDSGSPRTAESLAARFAAKEAFAKALGSPGGMLWTDAEVRSDARGRPYFVYDGTVLATAQGMGIDHVHVSLSHDGGIASAVVIAERSEAAVRSGERSEAAVRSGERSEAAVRPAEAN